MTLCKNAMNRVENTLQQQHRKSVRETTPLLVFMTAGTVHVNCLKINDKTREGAQNVYVHVYLQCV